MPHLNDQFQRLINSEDDNKHNVESGGSLPDGVEIPLAVNRTRRRGMRVIQRCTQ